MFTGVEGDSLQAQSLGLQDRPGKISPVNARAVTNQPNLTEQRPGSKLDSKALKELEGPNKVRGDQKVAQYMLD